MPQSRPWVSRAAAIAAVWLLALAPTAIAAGGADPGHKHKPVKKHASSKRSEREHEQSLKAFARKHRKLKHRLPIALVREKVQEQGEGAREILSGPAQVQVDQRAYPRHYVDDRIAAAGRQAFLANAGTAALATPWSELGPFTPAVAKEATYTGAPALNSGRVTAMAVDPNCGRAGSLCRMWIAAAGGGIFRTDDALAAHVVWTPADQGLTSDSFGSLIVDPTDASGNTLYAGSGEANGSSDSEAGVGLFKSTDGGQSWSLVPGSPAVAENRSIGAIAIDPDDGTLYIGTGEARHGLSSTTSGRRTPPNAPQLGLYKSTDGGQSFTLAFSRSGSGDPAKGTDVQRGGVNKIVIDPTAPAGRNDPRPIYVGFFGYGIWRSAPSLEGGDAGFKQVFATLFPADPLGDRTEFDLAALPDGKTRAYVGDGSAGSGEAHPPTSEFWRSDDVDQPAANLVAGGTNRAPWTKLSSSDPSAPGFASYNFCEGQCWYDEFVAADPSDPDIVFLGGSMQYDDLQVFGGDQRTNGRAVIRSTDAGETFNDMTNDATVDAGADTSLLAGGVTGMHPDQHAIAFDPFNPRFFFVGSDGGVIRVNGQYTNRTADCAARQLSGDALDPLPPGAALGARAQRLAQRRAAHAAVPERVAEPCRPRQRPAGRHAGQRDVGLQPQCRRARRLRRVRVRRRRRRPSRASASTRSRSHTYFGPTMDANFGGNERRHRFAADVGLHLPAADDAAAGDPDNPEAFSFYVPLDRTTPVRRAGDAVHRRRVRVAHDRQRRRRRPARRALPRDRAPGRQLAGVRRLAADRAPAQRRGHPGRGRATTSSPSSARPPTTEHPVGRARARAISGSRTTRTPLTRAAVQFTEVNAAGAARSLRVVDPRSTRPTRTTRGSPTRATRPTRRRRRATCSTSASTPTRAPPRRSTCSPSISATSR